MQVINTLVFSDHFGVIILRHRGGSVGGGGILEQHCLSDGAVA